MQMDNNSQVGRVDMSPLRSSNQANGLLSSWVGPLSNALGVGQVFPANMNNQLPPNVVQVVVTRDSGGYGMKVSGDNPVYVQSVKPGGPAERAGLHAGDKIIQVNGKNVVQAKHTEVVDLIKSLSPVMLTVQQRLAWSAASSNSNSRITSPQPVDHKTQCHYKQEKEQYFKLMIEKEQQHIDKLRSQIAVTPNEKKSIDLKKAEKNLRTLQDNLLRTKALLPHLDPKTNRPNSQPAGSFPTYQNTTDIPPPLPKRNKPVDINSTFINNEIRAAGDVPPPLPPRTYPPYNNQPPDGTSADPVNSLNSQMIYPLVSTLTTMVDGSRATARGKHLRTKSSPESLLIYSKGKGSTESTPSRESSSNRNSEQRETPPGTPPPPYPSPVNPTDSPPNSNNAFNMTTSLNSPLNPNNPFGNPTIPQPSPGNTWERIMSGASVNIFNMPITEDLAPYMEINVARFGTDKAGCSTPEREAGSPTNIITMEDDDIFDIENNPPADHKYFKSLTSLREHLPHLAVFINYVISNSNPNSLLFYLITDLYKEGTAKEMRKWAYEIHSCFTMPDSPLRLKNVNEIIATKIDQDLTNEYEREEIMRKIFFNARVLAKDEIRRQLTDFCQKRTAGLGTLYGPCDQDLEETYNDKVREQKLYETWLIPKVEPFLEEIEKENFDPQTFYKAAALVTIITRIFKVRPWSPDVEKSPTFVSKEKFKNKIIARYTRKLNYLDHTFVSQQFYTVTFCNTCHQIIGGISPQGFQCSACLINLHRPCIKLYDDRCPGPINRNNRGRLVGKFMGIRDVSMDPTKLKKMATSFVQNEKEHISHLEGDDARVEVHENKKNKSTTGTILDLCDFILGGFEEGQIVASTFCDLSKVLDCVSHEILIEKMSFNGINGECRSGSNLLLIGINELFASNRYNAAVSIAIFEETKDSNRVSRSSSDGKRPDTVTEERLNHQEVDVSAHSSQEDRLTADNKQDSISTVSMNLPSSSHSRRPSSNVNRSSSVKEQSEKKKPRRNISDPSYNASMSTNLDNTPGFSKENSESSSNSSMSLRTSESPCHSASVSHQTAGQSKHSDSEIEQEMDHVNWHERISNEEFNNLDPFEKKRQDVINELFHTESSHCQMLKVLYRLFYKRLHESQILKPDELNLIFPNIKELLDIHMEMDKEMKRIRKESPIVGDIGDMLVDTFGGPHGEVLQNAAAKFCERQQLALEFIKKRRERDSKFDLLLSECEKKRQCRRLQLQGIVPAEMQRLVKYPLLLDRLTKSVGAAVKSNCHKYQEELSKYHRAHNHSKDMLNFVNEAAKTAQNQHRLEEIQKHLDTSSFKASEHSIVNEFRTIDLTKYQLILEGSMQLRRPNKAAVTVHVLLLEEMVVILHRESEKFLLKFFQSGSPAQTQPFSPIIKMSTLLVRNNAVCKNALFLVNTSTNDSQMYDLVAEDETSREMWFKHFSDTAESYNKREGKASQLSSIPSSDSDSLEDVSATISNKENPT